MWVSVGGLWASGWFGLWLSGCRVEGVGVRAQGVGVWVSEDDLWVYGRFELWLSGCRVKGAGVEGVRCRGVGVCRYLWVVCGCMGGLNCRCPGVGLRV